MKPTKYELFEDNDHVILRAHSPEAVQGWFNVEVVKRCGARSLPGLRKHARHLAEVWGVPFEDKLGGDKLGDK